jgi:hypothetical protein
VKKSNNLEQSKEAWEGISGTDEKEKIEIVSPLSLTKRLQIMKSQVDVDSETFSENYGVNVGSGKIMDLVPVNATVNREKEKHNYSESTREVKRKAYKK